MRKNNVRVCTHCCYWNMYVFLERQTQVCKKYNLRGFPPITALSLHLKEPTWGVWFGQLNVCYHFMI